MIPAMRGTVSKLTFSKIFHLSQSLSSTTPPPTSPSRSFSSIDGGGGDRSPYSRREELSTATSHRPTQTQSAGAAVTNDEGRMYNRGPTQDPPEPIPNRPLRGDKPIHQSGRLPHRKLDDDDNEAGGFGFQKSTTSNKRNYNPTSTRVGGNKTSRISGSNLFPFGEEKTARTSPPQSFERKEADDFLDKFKLGFDKGEKPISNGDNSQLPKGEEIKGEQVVPEKPLPPPEDADDIFKKMKETGLIPNAVAMLDGLCKDGLVQEAMKLFGLMREKGTIPEIVIYTAVVEGFCKAHKLDDAKRIFRKMQNNGISPNAFSYTVLIQGLYKGKRLDDAVDFCVEMLEAGHSPNLATFTGLVDGFCREKGLEEAQSIIEALRQKGFFFDEKAVREYLDKKGPFLPLVWEAILGKKSLQRSF